MVLEADNAFHIICLCVKFLGSNLFCTALCSGKGSYLLCKAVIYALKVLSAADGPVGGIV